MPLCCSRSAREPSSGCKLSSERVNSHPTAAIVMPVKTITWYQNNPHRPMNPMCAVSRIAPTKIASIDARRSRSPCTRQSYNTPKVRFYATVGEEPEVEVGLV
jgi:hypothetical protein